MKVVTARPQRRRARRAWPVAVATLLGVLFAVASLSAVAVLVAPAQGNAAQAVLSNQPGATSWNPSTPITALLVGTDGGTNSAADGLIVAQFRPATNSLSLLAIPGNLWVSVPGFTDAPISQAYADGGARLTLVAVQSVLHMPIPYFATIDPTTAQALIDAIGPLAVRDPWTGSRAVSGTLGGSQTLAYLRVHPSGDGANRLIRELQILLSTRVPAFGPSNLGHLPAILDRLGTGISTNIPYSAVPGLAARLGRLHPNAITAAALDLANGSVTRFSSGGPSMLLPDPAGAPALARRLFVLPHLRAPGGVAVLNGSGITGQASALSAWLEMAGVPVRDTGPARSYGYSRTEVLLSPQASASDRKVAQTIATLLQVPVNQERASGAPDAVSVIIGSDYRDPTQH